MKIVSAPHSALFKKAKKVKNVNKRIKQLIKAMKKTLLEADNPKGIGLAAPQVGISLQIFIVKLNEESPLQVFINPKLIRKSKRLVSGKDIRGKEGMLEGCLSIPKIWGPVKRHQSVTISYQTEDGKTHKETFSNLMATVIQHEMDHLNGVLFTSRVIKQGGKLYQIAKDEQGKQVFKEINF